MRVWLLLALAATTAHADGAWLDRLDRALAVRSPGGLVRAEVSGLADLDAYWIDRSPPGLVFGADDGFMATPRLRLFLDATVAKQLYVFVQGRVDQGFDPRAESIAARADEYLLRWSPWGDPRLALQAGKFATAVGNWVPRHDSWENPLVTAPLPYERVTTISDGAVPDRPAVLATRRRLADRKRDWVPVIWGPSYTSGVAATGHVRRLDWAVELKNAAPSSRPGVWDWTHRDLAEPTVDARLGVRPGAPWNLGVSFAGGPYLRSDRPYAPVNPAGTDPDGGSAIDTREYRQWLVGTDASFGWRHLELWAEAFWSRFEVPFPCTTCSHGEIDQALDVVAYYLEARYRLSGHLWLAARWNQELFDRLRGFGGRHRAWDDDTWRTDAAVGWRLDRHWQVKLQYSWLEQAGSRPEGPQQVAAQATLRF